MHRSATRSAMVGALVTAGLAATGLGSPATANASCASFSGINIGSGCTSSLFGLAIGLGSGATADAAGLFSGSFSIGKNAEAISTGPLNVSVATGTYSLARVLGGFLNAAVAVGSATNDLDYAQADAGNSKGGFGNIALTLSRDSYAYAGGVYAYLDGPTEDAFGAGNIAVNLGRGNDVEGIGSVNGALGVGGKQPYVNNYVWATGVLNTATSIGGNVNSVFAGTSGSSFANSAFNFLGSNNIVTSGPGPLALAGSVFRSNMDVNKSKLGININGLKVPNSATSVSGTQAAASRRSSNAPSPAAAAKSTRAARG